MSLNLLEKLVIDEIKRPAHHPHTFQDIVKKFDEKLIYFNPTENCIPIKDYFGEGMGQVNATTALLQHQKIKAEWLRNYTTKKGKLKRDFKGIYIFMHNKKPFYIGISKGVIGRILQHIKGNNHNSAPLMYNIALLRHELISETPYLGYRNSFDFKNKSKPIKKFLLNQDIAFMSIQNDEELYLFEVYCSMKFKTILNKFETH